MGDITTDGRGSKWRNLSDMNAEVGKDTTKWKDVIRSNGEKITIPMENCYSSFALTMTYVILNTLFKYQEFHKIT